MTLRKLFGTLTLSALLSTSAFASDGLPVPQTLIDAKVVSVLPVLTSGPRAAAYQRLAAIIANREGQAGAFNPSSLVSLDGASGFGFAGASTDADIAILRLAFLVGSIPAVAGDPVELGKIVAAYDRSRETLAPLLPEVVASADQLVTAARVGRVDATALASAMKFAEEGIGHGPARAHGYFATGLWLGLTMHTVSGARADETLTSMAFPLAVMLEQDAEFGGSDLTLAAQMRKIASMLNVGGIDLDAYKSALATAMTVGADR